MSDIEWMPLSEYIDREFKGNVLAFHRTHKELCVHINTMYKILRRGEYYIVDGEIVHRKTTAKPLTINISSISAKYMRWQAAGEMSIEDIEEHVIDNSVKGERYGIDDIRYEFKDGSVIYYAPLFNKFYTLKRE